eukprot:COSAG02_NODE_2129_length_9739_cov_2.068568_2_plen_60_part_00
MNQLLNEYVGEFGTISNRRQNGLCRQHHAMVAQAIKRSRHMGALHIERLLTVNLLFAAL